MERAFGSFARSLTLPRGVDPDAVEASFDRGVLEVRIPQPEQPEQRKPRRVAIATSNGEASSNGEARTIEQ